MNLEQQSTAKDWLLCCSVPASCNNCVGRHVDWNYVKCAVLLRCYDWPNQASAKLPEKNTSPTEN